MTGDALADRMERAIACRTSRFFGVDTAGTTLDPRASFYALEGFTVGDHIFDSLDLVELLIVLGEELDLPLLEIAEDKEVTCIRELAKVIAGTATGTAQKAFCARWHD